MKLLLILKVKAKTIFGFFIVLKYLNACCWANIDDQTRTTAVNYANNNNNNDTKTLTHQLVKRMDLELCLDQFDIHKNTIIRTGESQAIGGKYLQGLELNTIDECQRLCCETISCDVYIFESKNDGYCYLFECGSLENFHCKFTRHANYTSAVLTAATTTKIKPLLYRPAVNVMATVATAVESAIKPTITTSVKTTKFATITTTMTTIVNTAPAPAPSPSPSPAPPPIITTTLISPSLQSTSHVIIASYGNVLNNNNYGKAIVSQQEWELSNLKENNNNANNIKSKDDFPLTQCSRFQFLCHSGECIAVYNVCDGIPQCIDGSDESSECINENDDNININNKNIIDHSNQQISPQAVEQQLQNRQQQLRQEQLKYYKSSLINNREDPNIWDNRKIYAANEQQQSVNEFNHRHYYDDILNSNSNSPRNFQLPLDKENSFTAYVNNHDGQQQQQKQQTLQLRYPYYYMAPMSRDSLEKVSKNVLLNMHTQQEEEQVQLPNNNIAIKTPIMRQRTSAKTFLNGILEQNQPHSITTLDDSKVLPQINIIKNHEFVEGNSTSRETKLMEASTKQLVKTEEHNVNNESVHENHSTTNSASSSSIHTQIHHPSNKGDLITLVTNIVPPVHEQYKMIHESLAMEFRDHDGLSDRPGSAVISLTLGVIVTVTLIILISCRMRTVTRRVRRLGNEGPFLREADFLVNGMYL